MEEDWDSWIAIIRQLVLSSKSPVSIHEINKKVKFLRGREIPLRKLQCETLEEMLNKIPDMIVCEKNNKFYVLAEAADKYINVLKTSNISSLEKTLKSIHQQYTQTKTSVNKSIDKKEQKSMEPVTRINDKNNTSHIEHNGLQNLGTNRHNNVTPDSKISNENSNKLQNPNDATKSFNTASERKNIKIIQVKNSPIKHIGNRCKYVNSSGPAPPPSQKYNKSISSPKSTHGQNYAIIHNAPTISVSVQQQNFNSFLQLNPNNNQYTSSFTTSLQHQNSNTFHNKHNFMTPRLPNQNSNLNVTTANRPFTLQQPIFTVTKKMSEQFDPTKDFVAFQDSEIMNWESTDPRLYLHCYTRANNLPDPEYKHLSAINTVYAVVSVQSRKYSSYPHIVQSKELATKIAARYAVEDLLGKLY